VAVELIFEKINKYFDKICQLSMADMGRTYLMCR
jgi:hypothetical protein